jgi:leader peptidase (prepilin peptidase) / N-methyltransferase
MRHRDTAPNRLRLILVVGVTKTVQQKFQAAVAKMTNGIYAKRSSICERPALILAHSPLAANVVTVALTITLGAIAVIDHRTLRIPDVLSIPLIIGGLLISYGMSALPFRDHLIGAIVGFSVLWAIGEWFFRRFKTEGLGIGDAKLFAASGAWLGWQALPTVLLIATLCALAFTIATRASGRQIAFGPWLALALWIVWVWQLYLSSTLAFS